VSAPWACPDDGTPLDVGTDDHRCAKCGRALREIEGVLDFRAAGGGDSVPAAPFSAVSEALDGKTGEARECALSDFCNVHGYRRTLHGGDWKLLLPVENDSTVLEIGPGLGEVTAELASRAQHLVTLTSNPHAAALVRAQVVAAGRDNVSIGCTDQLLRLPLEDNSIDSIAVSENGLLGFSLSGKKLGAIAAELRRVARPGATLLIGQSNPLYRLPGVSRLRTRVKSGWERSIDGAIQRASIPPGAARWSRAATVSAMTGAGFQGPRLFAPIPDEEWAMAILPVADRTVVRYFLDHLVRRNALSARAVLTALRPIVALGQFWRIVPYWYLVFEL